MSSSADFIMERFGRYLLLDHIQDGGMGKICRARFLGEQADKIVTIKMIHEKFVGDEELKRMFLDEIRVTFGLIHPNIAQTYDYGEHAGQVYTAMEYVDGKNLKEFIDKLRERKFVFPVEICVHIIANVCQGLNYAHTLSDKMTGKKMNIIHRDISPHNIMLTYDGAVKIIDFGIAKAESNSDKTQAGTIKGKLSYLAPEYIDGLDLDPRYDEFAVGITLWELLCCRKLFKAKNDLAVLKLIQSCKVPPPSSVNPNVPKELDAIVLKALSRDREKRYINLDELNRALIKFLYSNYPDFNASDLGHFAKELFKTEIKTDRQKMYQFGKIDLVPYFKEIKEEKLGIKKASPTNDEAPDALPTNDDVRVPRPPANEARRKGVKKPLEIEMDYDDEQTEKLVLNKKKKIRKKSVKLDKTMSQDVKVTRDEMGDDATSVSREMVGEDTSTDIDINTKGLRKKFKKKHFAILALLIIGGVVFFTPEPETANNVAGMDTTVEMKKQPEPIKQVYGKIIITNYDFQMHNVYVDDKPVKPSVLGEIDLLVRKKPFQIMVSQKGKELHYRTISLSKEKVTSEFDIPNLESARYGYLVTSSACVDGTISYELFGKRRTEPLPIKKKPGLLFPLSKISETEFGPKKYTVSYMSADETVKRSASFTVSEEGELIDFCENLY